MARYVPNKKEFDRLATSPMIRDLARDAGNYYADRLRAIAPRSSRVHEHYADSIEVTTERVVLQAGPRTAARITVNVEHAAALEFGNAHVRNPPRPLNRLLDEIRAADPNLRTR